MPTPNLGLPQLAADQAQKHVTVNEALYDLDALVQLAVLDRSLDESLGKFDKTLAGEQARNAAERDSRAATGAGSGSAGGDGGSGGGLGDGTLELKQSFQMLEGVLTQGDQALPISDATLRGTEISFTAGGRRYTGQANGDAMSGRVDGEGGEGRWTARRSAG